MSIYKLLYDYSFRITGSLDQSAAIVSAAIFKGIEIAYDSNDVKKAHDYMLNTVRAKSYEYARLMENPDYAKAAEELNEPVGMIRQIVRGIREGRYK
jgi:hypothetical protein